MIYDYKKYKEKLEWAETKFSVCLTIWNIFAFTLLLPLFTIIPCYVVDYYNRFNRKINITEIVNLLLQYDPNFVQALKSLHTNLIIMLIATLILFRVMVVKTRMHKAIAFELNDEDKVKVANAVVSTLKQFDIKARGYDTKTFVDLCVDSFTRDVMVKTLKNSKNVVYKRNKYYVYYDFITGPILEKIYDCVDSNVDTSITDEGVVNNAQITIEDIKNATSM